MTKIHYKNTSILIACCALLVGCAPNKSVEIDKTKADNHIVGSPYNLPPPWTSSAVWYQIFPERFNNGDADNDPTREDIQDGTSTTVPKDWQITPWNQDWYKEDAYFAKIDGGDFNHKTSFRRYGGDLQGVLDKLDYLQSLGVNAIYFNPLNDSPSLHKYDARNWHHIDRNFGPNPSADKALIAGETPSDPTTWSMTHADRQFIELVDKLHKRGMRVIMDFSWNHTGNSFWAWQDILKNQSKSEFADWYWIKSFDDPKTEKNEFNYRGWFGVETMPEIKETSYMTHSEKIEPFEGNLANQAAKDHIFAVTARWLDPNGDGDPSDGVDGFRLDVAAELPLGFWRDYRQFVRTINPEAFLIGEVWWEQYPDDLLDPKPFLEGDVFDAVMNYRWYRAARQFFANTPNEIAPSEFVDKLNAFTGNLQRANNYAMMNMTASHDSPRLATSMFNDNKYKFEASAKQNADYKIHKPDQQTYQTLKNLLVHQYTYIGAPQIWAGDEMGMWGSDDPHTRKPLIWPDYQFEDEVEHPLNHKRTPDKVNFDQELFNYYQTLISIRKQYSVLTNGEIEFVYIDDQLEILAYSRFDQRSEIITVFNKTDKVQTIHLPSKQMTSYRNLLTGIEFQPEAKQLVITLPPQSAQILASEK